MSRSKNNMFLVNLFLADSWGSQGTSNLQVSLSYVSNQCGTSLATRISTAGIIHTRV